MALTAHKKRRMKKIDPQPTVRNMDVKASTTIYNGSLVSLDATGTAVPAVAAQNEFFMGVARAGYDNTVAAATTDRPLIVESGHIELCTFDGAITDADLGKAVWYKDSGTVTLTNPATIAQAQIGILVSVETSPDGWVDISKAVSA
jgi:hypothetical protein